jgi:hypothetical protein
MLSKQELSLILQLVANSTIKGGDALIVGALIQKIQGLIEVKDPEISTS